MPDPEAAAGHPQYFIRVRGRVLGPFTLAKLKLLRSRGQFSRAHEFSTDRETWQPASLLEELLEPVLTPSGPAEPVAAGPAAAGAVPSLPQPGSSRTGATPGALWYYNVAGELYGPVSIFDLRTMAAGGNLRADDYVWKEGMPNWLPIAQVPELKPPPAGSPGSGAVGALPAGAQRDGFVPASGMAVASLLLGIFGIIVPFAGLVLSLLAVVFGALSLKAIVGARGALGGRGMAIAGLVLGAMGLALWCLGIAWLLGMVPGPRLPDFWQNS